MRALGARVERTGEGAWRIHGVGVGGFAKPAGPLDFGNSGTGVRLAIGAVAGSPVTATFDRRCLACAGGRCGACSIRWRKWARA